MSYDVRIKEEPVDFECSPCELLNEIGNNDDVTEQSDDVTDQSDDVRRYQERQLDGELSGEQPVIKLEYEGVVKTEVLF